MKEKLSRNPFVNQVSFFQREEMALSDTRYVAIPS